MKHLIQFFGLFLFILLLPSVMADLNTQEIIKNGEPIMNNIPYYSIGVTLLLIASVIYIIIVGGQSESQELLKSMREAQEKADMDCQRRRMSANNVKTDDFNTYHYSCFMKSPYYEVPLEVSS